MSEHYRIANLNLESPYPIPELSSTKLNSFDKSKNNCLKIVSSLGCEQKFPNYFETKKYSLSGELCLEVSKLESNYYFRFSSGVNFFIDTIENQIHIVESANKDRAFVNHLILDHVIPLYLSTRGYLVLHGSVLERNNCGLLLLGASGSGKSSLAAHLAKGDWRVLADDFSLVGPQLELIPSYPSLRIWPNDLADLPELETKQSFQIEEMGNKKNIILDASSRPIKLSRVILLEPNASLSSPRFSSLNKADKLLKIIKASFVLEPNSAQLGSTLFEIASKLTREKVIDCLEYSRLPGFQKNLAELIEA